MIEEEVKSNVPERTNMEITEFITRWVDKAADIPGRMELISGAPKMSRLERIIDHYQEEEFLTSDGFDDAVIGVEPNSMRIVYAIELCLEILMERDGMEYDEAIEYMDFNVIGAYVGEKTPIFIYIFQHEQ